MLNNENDRRQAIADTALATLIAVLAAGLIVAGTALSEGRNTRASLAVTADFTHLMGLTSAGLGIILLLWWCTALLLAIIGQLLHGRGHAALSQRIAGWSPGFMRRLVVVVFSLNLVATPAMASAPGQQPVAVQSLGAGASSAQMETNQLLNPLWKSTEGRNPGSAGNPLSPRWTPAKNAPVDNVITRGPLRHAEAQAGEPTVAVQPGDTLWSLCAEHLGPYATDVEIAKEWPRWYEANRQVIGADPNLLLPGQVLRIPETPET